MVNECAAADAGSVGHGLQFDATMASPADESGSELSEVRCDARGEADTYC